jgi:peptidoglycan/LPS O-acetylase OafA/YrhL
VYGSVPPFLHQLPTYLYLQNFDIFNWFTVNSPGHYWTLAIEEHFYLFWPLLIFFVNKKNFKYIFVSLFISIMLLKYVMHTNGYFISQFTFTRMDQLMLGGVLAFMELNKFFDKPNNFKTMLLVGVSFTSLLILVFFNYSLDSTFMWVSKHTLIGCVLFALLGVLLFEKKLKYVNWVLKSKLLQYFGKISYGFYVWHFFCIKLLNHIYSANNFLIDFVLTFLFTTLLAHISFYYFESFFIKLKDKKYTKSIKAP